MRGKYWVSKSFFWVSLVSMVQLLFQRLDWIAWLWLAVKVLLLQIVVVKFVVHVLMIVNPGGNHVRILFMKVHTWGLTVEQYWLVVPNLICGQGSWSVKKHFPPQVRVLAGLVHGSIRLEVLLDVQLVFLKKGINFLIIRWIEHLIEIATHSVLLIVESVDVRSADSEHVLCKQLAKHTPIYTEWAFIMILTYRGEWFSASWWAVTGPWWSMRRGCWPAWSWSSCNNSMPSTFLYYLLYSQ